MVESLTRKNRHLQKELAEAHKASEEMFEQRLRLQSAQVGRAERGWLGAWDRIHKVGEAVEVNCLCHKTEVQQTKTCFVCLLTCFLEDPPIPMRKA